MDERFLDREHVLRAVRFDERFWTEDGRLTSAAFKDERGTSVDRTGDRGIDESVRAMRERGLRGAIASVSVPECREHEVHLVWKPGRPPHGNRFHSELHGSETVVPMSRRQLRKLARCAVVRTTTFTRT